MAKPIPPPEDAKIRKTISIAATIFYAAVRYRTKHPEDALNDFSAIASKAIAEYILKREPGLLGDIANELRMSGQQTLMVAEAAVPYNSAAQQAQLVRQVALSKLKSKPKSGGSTKDGGPGATRAARK